MSAADDLLDRNRGHAESFGSPGLAPAPALHMAVVACMDARLDVFAALGLKPGEAHVIRNAGGVVTDDVIRSLAISQRKLGTREVVLVHHTGCGMLGLVDEEFADAVARDAGERPPWPARGFTDLEDDVRDSMARIRQSPFLPQRDAVRGFVYDVETGRLREVR